MANSSGNAGSLFFGMTLDTKEFKKRLKTARKNLKAASKQMKEDLASIAKGGTILAAGIGAGSVAMLAFAKSTAEATNEQLLLADSIGATQSEIAGLELSADKFGVSQDMLIDKMREAGGIDAFKDIANQVKGAGDETEQLAKAQELLGNEGLKLLPILQQGAGGLAAMEAEAQRLGLALSPEQIAETRVAWDEYESTLMSIQGLAKQLGTALMEPFGRASAAVKGFVDAFRTDIINAFNQFSDFFNSAIQVAIEAFAKFGIPFINGFMQFANALGQTFADIFNFISEEGSSVFGGLGDFFLGFIDFMATFKQVFIAGVSDTVGVILKGTFNALATFSNFVGDMVIEITALAEELGLVGEGMTDAVAESFGDQAMSLRTMGKELAKPFEDAAEENINEAADILEKQAQKNAKAANIFTSTVEKFSMNFESATKTAAKVAVETKEDLMKATEQRAGMILTGSQEEARLLSSSQDKNLQLQQKQLRAQENTNSLLKAIGAV